MHTVTQEEAQARLPDLLDEVRLGEEVLIVRDGALVAKLVAALPGNEPRGSPAALLAALQNGPKVPSEWVDELEEVIAEGVRPATKADPFKEIDDGDRPALHECDQ